MGYQPGDVIAELDSDLPRRALFTTFTFSPGAFQQQYVHPLVQHGCGDIAVLADRRGYAQSLFAAAAVQGIGTDYRLRQVSAPGAFHGKLVLIRTGGSMIVGVGSGNLTASGLQTNSEVGALYSVKAREQLGQLDNLAMRLRHLAGLDEFAGEKVDPISLSDNSRLLTSLDNALIDQMNLPDGVRRIEVVSPFVDGQLEVLRTIRDLWPEATIQFRLDPGFGALGESLLEFADDHVEVLVPVEPKENKEEGRRPPVHGKLICFIGDDNATAILGSANLSRPALLTQENFEAVVERRMSAKTVNRLLSVPGVRWRKAVDSDRRSFSFADSQLSISPLVATLTLRQLQLKWDSQTSSTGVAKIWCRGRCVFEQQLANVNKIDGHNLWNHEIGSDVKDSLVASCFAEVELDNGKRFRGWVDVTDLLMVAPEAKCQLALLDTIATDPLECKEKDVVKFIELLQRNLKSSGQMHTFSVRSAEKKSNEEYEDTPIQRSLLMESGSAGGIGQSALLNQLINRSLDTALRDLRFFGRDNSGRGSGTNRMKERAGAEGSSRSGQDAPPLPSKIGAVLNQLFCQLADAFNNANTVRETSELIGQIPTCLKALSYAVERWIPRSQSSRMLNHHFHKVAIACLAPGISSTLHKTGAVRRVVAKEQGKLLGGSDFALGVAMLETYLLLLFSTSNDEIRQVLKDMHDVLDSLPLTQLDELNAAGAELVEIEHSEDQMRPDFGQLRQQVGETIGELAGLRCCREALHQLIAMVGCGVRSKTELRPLAERAIGAGEPHEILNAVESAGSRVQLVEIESTDMACPECCTTFPVSVCSLLSNTTRVWRCSCGVLLARSLEQ